MKRFVPLIVLLIASLSWFGFRRQATPPDLSTPKATVRSFVAALIAKDSEGVAACVQGAVPGSELKTLLQNDLGLTSHVTGAEVKDITAEVDGEAAKVAVEVIMQAPPALDREGAKVTLSVVELFQVQRQNGQWRIVPDATIGKQLADRTVVGTHYELRPLATMAALVASPAAAIRDINTARDQAIATSCISNEKQLALGVLMYVQDYDEMFPRKKAPYKDLIMPYVKNDAIFTCPTDTKGTLSYTFNPNMQGTALAYVQAPAQTVLFYEGKDMRFAFKHNGKTAVAFADGHVKLITPEQVKQVFWYPAGKTPGVVKRPQTKPGAPSKRKPAR